MIKYALVCENAHEFESWFPNSDAFEKQVKRGLVDCPTCGSQRVSKGLMAPRVSTSRKKEALAERMRAQIAKTPAAPIPVPIPTADPQSMALLDERHAELRAAIRELHANIIANTEDVGKKFPEQARKMHEGHAPARSIRGEATLEEAKELWEEGIPVLPVPSLPEERN